MRALACALALALAPLTATAAEDPRPGPADPRIQFVDYDPDQVVRIRAQAGYQLMLEFAPEERIENVSIGDSVGWQVTPNRRANLLFLKPIDGPSTNMTVVTNLRRYAFELGLAEPLSAVPPPFTVRFIYPAPALVLALPPEPERPPQVANASYSVTGSQEAAPARVFDDGTMTYFEWGPQASLPAIFAVGSDGAESVVNYTVRGPHVIVEQLAGQFTLRNGSEVATVTNHTYPVAAPKRRSR